MEFIYRYFLPVLKTRIIIRYLLLFIVSVFFSQCEIVHLATIRKADYEPRSEYNHYLSKHGFDTTYSFQLNSKYFDSISSIKYALNLYKVEHNGKASVSQLRMYDNHGHFIYGYEQCFGDIDFFNVLDSLPFKKEPRLPVNMNLSFEKDLNWINLSDIEKHLILRQNSIYPFTIIAVYALWPGWYSHHTLKRLNDYVNKYGKENFLIIYVNMTREK